MPAVADPPNVVPPAPGVSAEQAAERAAATTLHVSGMQPSGEPPKPPKPGSAKAKFFAEMSKKFGGEERQAPPAASEKPGDKAPVAHKAAPSEQPKPEAGEAKPPPAAPQPGAKPGETPPAPAAEPATTDKTGKKVSPWKMVDEWKARATQAEQRILDLQKQVIPEAERKASEEKIKGYEAKIKEMTDELRFFEAEKYDPDVIKAKDAYSKSFVRALKELKNVTVIDQQTEKPRTLTVNDLAELAFMDLGEAQQVAETVFGKLAPYVMDHRNEIRRLWEEQQSLIDDLKKNGATREQQRNEAKLKSETELTNWIDTNYRQANAEVVADPKHGHLFKPREGDEEWNSRLQKGFALVDEVMAKGPQDPSLSPEQRIQLIRKHAAVRNMAAGWRPLRYENARLRDQLAKAEAELKEFKDTTPPTGGRQPEPATPERPKGIKGVYADLAKIAH